VGFAVTLVPVDELNVAAGVHVYVDAPVAVNVVDAPGQIVAEFTVTVGKGLTVTTEVIEEVQVPVVPTMVYVVVTVGFAVTLAPVVALNPVDALQLYVVAPPAVNVVEFP
jgi:hypothetical protein